MIRSLIDNKCKQIVLAFSQKNQERTVNDEHTSIFKLMQKDSTKMLLSGSADKVYYNKVSKIAVSKHHTNAFNRHFIKSTIYKVTVGPFATPEGGTVLHNEAIFWQDITRK